MNDEYTKAMPNQIDVHLFGNFEIHYNGSVLDSSNISSDKIIRLLSYLLIYRNQKLTEQQFYDILWENNESENPAGALKNLIYRIRVFLNKSLGKQDYILTSRGSYSWNPKIPVKLDIEEFVYYVSKSKMESDDDASISDLEHAFSVFRGSFLPSLSDAHWVISLDTYYFALYQDSNKDLSELYEKTGQYDKMTKICLNALEKDPYDESLYYYLVKSYYYQNKIQLAKDAYNHALQVLESGLGIESPTQLLSLRKTLLSMNNIDIGNIEDVSSTLQEEKPRSAYLCDFGVF